MKTSFDVIHMLFDELLMNTGDANGHRYYQRQTEKTAGSATQGKLGLTSIYEINFYPSHFVSFSTFNTSTPNGWALAGFCPNNNFFEGSTITWGAHAWVAFS